MSIYIIFFSLKWRIWQFREPLDYYLLLMGVKHISPLQSSSPIHGFKKTWEKCSGSTVNQMAWKLLFWGVGQLSRRRAMSFTRSPAREAVSPARTPAALPRRLWPNPSCFLPLLMDIRCYGNNTSKLKPQLLNFHLCCLELYSASTTRTCGEPAATARLSGKPFSLGLVQKSQGCGRTRKDTWG